MNQLLDEIYLTEDREEEESRIDEEAAKFEAYKEGIAFPQGWPLADSDEEEEHPCEPAETAMKRRHLKMAKEDAGAYRAHVAKLRIEMYRAGWRATNTLAAKSSAPGPVGSDWDNCEREILKMLEEVPPCPDSKTKNADGQNEEEIMDDGISVADSIDMEEAVPTQENKKRKHSEKEKRVKNRNRSEEKKDCRKKNDEERTKSEETQKRPRILPPSDEGQKLNKGMDGLKRVSATHDKYPEFVIEERSGKEGEKLQKTMQNFGSVFKKREQKDADVIEWIRAKKQHFVESEVQNKQRYDELWDELRQIESEAKKKENELKEKFGGNENEEFRREMKRIKEEKKKKEERADAKYAESKKKRMEADEKVKNEADAKEKDEGKKKKEAEAKKPPTTKEFDARIMKNVELNHARRHLLPGEKQFGADVSATQSERKADERSNGSDLPWKRLHFQRKDPNEKRPATPADVLNLLMQLEMERDPRAGDVRDEKRAEERRKRKIEDALDQMWRYGKRRYFEHLDGLRKVAEARSVAPPEKAKSFISDYIEAKMIEAEEMRKKKEEEVRRRNEEEEVKRRKNKEAEKKPTEGTENEAQNCERMEVTQPPVREEGQGRTQLRLFEECGCKIKIGDIYSAGGEPLPGDLRTKNEVPIVSLAHALIADWYARHKQNTQIREKFGEMMEGSAEECLERFFKERQSEGKDKADEIWKKKAMYRASKAWSVNCYHVYIEFAKNSFAPVNIWPEKPKKEVLTKFVVEIEERLNGALDDVKHQMLCADAVRLNWPPLLFYGDEEATRIFEKQKKEKAQIRKKIADDQNGLSFYPKGIRRMIVIQKLAGKEEETLRFLHNFLPHFCGTAIKVSIVLLGHLPRGAKFHWPQMQLIVSEDDPNLDWKILKDLGLEDNDQKTEEKNVTDPPLEVRPSCSSWHGTREKFEERRARSSERPARMEYRRWRQGEFCTNCKRRGHLANDCEVSPLRQSQDSTISNRGVRNF